MQTTFKLFFTCLFYCLVLTLVSGCVPGQRPSEHVGNPSELMGEPSDLVGKWIAEGVGVIGLRGFELSKGGSGFIDEANGRVAIFWKVENSLLFIGPDDKDFSFVDPLDYTISGSTLTLKDAVGGESIGSFTRQR